MSRKRPSRVPQHNYSTWDSPTDEHVASARAALVSGQRISRDDCWDELRTWDGQAEGPTKLRKVVWRNTEDLMILASVRKFGTQWPRIAEQLPGRTADAVTTRPSHTQCMRVGPTPPPHAPCYSQPSTITKRNQEPATPVEFPQPAHARCVTTLLVAWQARNRWHRLQQTHTLGNGEEGGVNMASIGGALLASGVTLPVSMMAEHQHGLAPGPEEHSEGSGVERKTGSAHGRSMWTEEEDQLIEEGVRRFGCKWRQIATALPGRSDSSIRNRWMRMQREKAEGDVYGLVGQLF